MLLLLLQHIFSHIWDRRAQKRKRETASNSPHYHAHAANQLFGLFFISLFPGQNAAFQTQQYCTQTEKKNLKKIVISCFEEMEL